MFWGKQHRHFKEGINPKVPDTKFYLGSNRKPHHPAGVGILFRYLSPSSYYYGDHYYGAKPTAGAGIVFRYLSPSKYWTPPALKRLLR